MARRDDGGTFFSARRNRPALERALSDLAPAPWKQTARDTSSARNTDSTIKRFAGDPRLAAALLPLAQTILGGLLSRLALGGIAQGARAVRLSDGSIIRVVTNSGIHIIEIDCRAASAPSGSIVVFALHPHSDSAPQGWWFPTEEATARVAMDEVEEEYYYPRHSYYSDEGVDTNFWWDIYHRPHASLTVNPQEQRCTLVMDRDIWFGNQTVYAKSGGAVWSWWHSPHGDAPLVYRSDDPTWHLRARHTPYLSGGLKVVVHYDPGPPAIAEFATITPCVFRNSQWVWSYSDDNIGDFSNAITANDSAIIGGVYPVTADRILVVVLTNAARTATLWDVTVHPPDLSTKTSVWTATVDDENTSAMRWPWRFHPDGTECSTIVAYTLDSPAGGGAKYTEYKIWTLTISYNEGTDAFSVSKAESEAYYLKYKNDNVLSQSGFVVSGVGTWTASYSTDSSVSDGFNQIPFALAYAENGTRVTAWIDAASTVYTQSSSSSYSGSIGPGGLTGGSSSSGSSSGTNNTNIVIGDYQFSLLSHSYSHSSSTEETKDPGEQTYSTAHETTHPLGSKKILYLDVLSKTIILYAISNAASTSSGSVAATWSSGGEPEVETSVGGSTIHHYGNFLWYGDDVIFSDPLDVEIPVESTLMTAPLTFEQTHTVPQNISDTTYFYGLYPDQSQLSIDMGFGMALDQNGEFFILSYDCLERDVLGTTLARQAGNYSNAPNLAAALTFEGENKLLFPLGIGVVGSL